MVHYNILRLYKRTEGSNAPEAKETKRATLTVYSVVEKEKVEAGAQKQEQATPILGLCYGVCTDWFGFRSLFAGNFK